jgi:hypothetical protein
MPEGSTGFPKRIMRICEIQLTGLDRNVGVIHTDKTRVLLGIV